MRRLAPCLLLMPAAACGAFTREEAEQALEEIKINSQVAALTAGSVEVATDFTLGEGAERAAEELASFIQSQLPCAEVTREGATLSVEYGAKAGLCLYRGQRFSGTHSITVQKNGEAQVQVAHTWEGLSNGLVEYDGEAMVTWDFEALERRVVHQGEWIRLADGRTGAGSGDRVQRALDGGLAEGFEVDGEREWEGARGDWELEIDRVGMRWADPVPFTGRYVLDTPFDKRLTVGFAEAGENRIRVTLSGPRRSYDIEVVALGRGGG